ncbi:hypothetical protein A3G67_03550 [Candidatus Roizmanbacteria bacterium RIFCSPLOWO2_12_FULL_40_12]|uniref:Uncharacterized protein n=1 Tax=Candidatus Roizmanbacteria bacterium RIFCSPLOWO2_01_FULL_40_42 TaxID=1802066 RepID=A0A1F7J5M2_9BACT|nr:MAG: hypothetical protein A2779_03185 [Candidatus Roizmanbacteria bacterium RIFCSPHIGHO2_01_FULL_40_98]OGK28343.1 MAG: hypothetical protein A3C31_00550 [Candidatus Roizmanbacteria bacterium RIFCSPHIGHO2_02_FULL_40_53]OGK30579.1 MAG: hypothetical protein A2W49_03235 [Candidatus Roizmanbacteria bacterium RIFCSPHIGHO2_12_41_18]OGK36993.1 MAG: hypothetical protein A3E69_00810 [Candidatus Roizmanbacteria bacterium RIFCSPHIGHO2_12_FULL_40_130]OGK50899.1 MAG: hypothetical protein A3B50_01320 [Candi
MKKTKINLLSDRQDYARLERYFLFLRIGVLLYAFVLFGIIAIFAYFLFQQNNQVQSLLEKKKTYLTTLNVQKEDEAKLIYISKKVNAYQTFLKDDARFLPYFTLLNNTLKTSSQAGTLSGFVIDKNRDVEFKLSFARLEDMLASFKFVESDQFLQNFEELSLVKFLSQSTTSQKNYEISFEGKFMELNEKNEKN